MEQEDDIFEYGIKGGEPPKGFGGRLNDFIIKKSKIIFLTILTIILILGIFFAGYSLKKCPECPECEICEECSECPEFDYNLCPEKKVNVIKYACSNGMIVDDIDECDVFKTTEIKSKYKARVNNVTLSIDKIEYSKKGNYNTINRIDYTIINHRQHDIYPEIVVNLYSDDVAREDMGLVHELFELEQFIESESWIKRRETVNIGFLEDPEDMVIRLVLRDTVPDPDQILVRVSRPLEE